MSRFAANHRTDDTSSSQGLSSPPSASPTQLNAPPSESLLFDTASRPVKNEQNNNDEASKSGGKGRRAASASAGAGESAPTVVTRKPRKKKDSEPNPNGNNPEAGTTTTFGVDGKVKKPRAPRGTSVAFQKKMLKKAQEEAEEAAWKRSQIERDLARTIPPSPPQPRKPPTPRHFGVPSPTTTTAPAPHQSGNREAIQNPITNYTHSVPTLQNAPQRPASGQNYDPIRSSTIAPQPTSPIHPTLTTPTKPLKTSSASASPSISSLIDPPDPKRTSYSMFSEQQPRRSSHDHDSLPPDPKRPRITPPATATTSESHPPHPSPPTSAPLPFPLPPNLDAMELDTDTSTTIPPPPKKPSPNGTSTPLSTAPHSPKPARPTTTTTTAPKSPLPTSGSGLLSGSVFGTSSTSTTTNPTSSTTPTVVLDIPLTGESNQYINFSELAEKRYGFNALHPRLAAQRRRLADVAAMGAAIEKNASKTGTPGGGVSTDDRSVDLSADEAAEDESNVEMGGMLAVGAAAGGVNGNGNGNGAGKSAGEETTGAAGAGGKPARKKRMMKEDMYDKEDDFVDDTELAWEEQAAVSKDGFFVYSGLLVPEGEEARVERNDPPPKRGGRGGGRGSRGGRGGGSRGGGGANSAAAAAANANKDGAGGKDGKAPMRKSRTTKADKERMEREKSQRETLAPLASKPVGYVVGFAG